jgi:hypothetical protein
VESHKIIDKNGGMVFGSGGGARGRLRWRVIRSLRIKEAWVLGSGGGARGGFEFEFGGDKMDAAKWLRGRLYIGTH